MSFLKGTMALNVLKGVSPVLPPEPWPDRRLLLDSSACQNGPTLYRLIPLP